MQLAPISNEMRCAVCKQRGTLGNARLISSRNNYYLCDDICKFDNSRAGRNGLAWKKGIGIQGWAKRWKSLLLLLLTPSASTFSQPEAYFFAQP